MSTALYIAHANTDLSKERARKDAPFFRLLLNEAAIEKSIIFSSRKKFLKRQIHYLLDVLCKLKEIEREEREGIVMHCF